MAYLSAGSAKNKYDDNDDRDDNDDNDDNDEIDDNRIPRAYAVEMALPLPTLSDTVPLQTERPSGGQ